MDGELLRIISDDINAGRNGVLCTITESSGSTPRGAGASMWVRCDGSAEGTVGGGLAEFEVIERAKQLLTSGETNCLYRKELTEGHGMVCGGTLSVFMEVVGRCDELVIFGAGHVGRAVAKLGAFIGFKVTVWDERADLTAEEFFPAAHRLSCPLDKIYENGLSLHSNSYVVIMTRGHLSDADVVAATDGKPGAYYGMIGSRSKIAALRDMLLRQGVSKEHLDRIHQPIGLPIRGETPEEIAVSVIAEIIAVKRGGDIEALRKC